MPGKAMPLWGISDVVAARQACREGTCVITDQSEGTVSIVRVVVEDHGPGIPDLDSLDSRPVAAWARVCRPRGGWCMSSRSNRSRDVWS